MKQIAHSSHVQSISTNISDSGELPQLKQSTRINYFKSQQILKIQDNKRKNSYPIEIQNQNLTQDQHLRCNQIEEEQKLQNIFDKIHYNNLKYENCKQFINHYIQQLTNHDFFFEILFNSTKSFNQKQCQKIKRNLNSIIINLKILNDISVLSENNFNCFEFENIFHNKLQYMKIFKIIEQEYKEIQRASDEVYQIVKLLQKINLNNKNIEFDTYDFYFKMFNYVVFEDPIIKSFINHIFQAYNQNANQFNKQDFLFIQQLDEFLKFLENRRIDKNQIQMIKLNKPQKIKQNKPQKAVEQQKNNFDLELKEFEKRLENNDLLLEKAKPNISQEWLKKIQFLLQKIKNKL